MIEVRWMGRVGYADGLALQDRTVAELRTGEGPETLLLLEHEPVYTIGRTRDRSSLGRAVRLPHPVVETNRGGQATFHGPGQLVGYPILDLARRGRDLHAYLRAMERLLMEGLGRLGIEARSREGLTGVWVGPRKIASIGVGVRHWISMHGFALNVGLDLSGFDAITPCGISGVEMTSIGLETGTALSVEAAAGVFGGGLREGFERLLPELEVTSG